jgi:ribosomal-protein-alanine acetyltransferase
VTIRPLVATDASGVAALDTGGPWTAADYERIARGEFPDRLCLVAEEPPGRIGGVLLASLVVPDAEILNVAVDPALRRKGIATALMAEGARLMAEAGAWRLTLEVRASNVPAQGLYTRLGFRQMGRRFQYYQSPAEDALLLESALPLC